MLAVGLVASGALTGCGGDDDEAFDAAAAQEPGATRAPDSSATDAGPADVRRVKLSPDGKTLILGLTVPPCQPVSSATVTEALASVQVSVRLGKVRGDCGEAAPAWTTVTLKNPLSGRVVIDVERAKVIKVDGT